MAEPKAGFGSSEPMNRSEQRIGMPFKTVKFWNLNCLEKGRRGPHNLLHDYCMFLPSKKPNFVHDQKTGERDF
jgi:hypothetical protein